MKQKSNQQLVLDFYQKAIGEQDLDFASRSVKENYIQHNPNVKTGKVGFLEAINYLKSMPKPENPKKPFMRVFADNEFVILHLGLEIAGIEKVVIDIFRIEDGLIAEHWDAIQNVSTNSKNGLSEIEGPIIIKNENATTDNKNLIREYTEEVLITKEFELIEEYVSLEFIQHNPNIELGSPGICKYYERVKDLQIHRIFGQGNFVLSQASGVIDDYKMVFYDIYRIEDGRIAEQWSVSQKIPEKMAHNNGMI